MTTTQERLRILKMIEEKQITAEEGARLLEALRSSATEATGREAPQKARWLRVRVTDRATGRVKVNVNLPVGLLDVGLKMGARFAPDIAGMELSSLQEAIKQGLQGRIIEVEDEKDNERVEVYVE